jgi:hypothetical protein
MEQPDCQSFNTNNFVEFKDINGNNTTIGMAWSGWTGNAAEGLIFPLTYIEEALFPPNVMKGFWFTEG